MAIDPAFLVCMNQKVVLERFCGVSDAGDPLFSDKESICARVEFKNQTVVNASGEEVASNVMIYTPDRIGERDRLWLPGSDVNDKQQSRLTKSVEEQPDETGATHHFEVAV